MWLLLSITALIIIFVLLVFCFEPLACLPAFEWLAPHIIFRVRTDLPFVALSFDDGPRPVYTTQVLEILQRHDAKASFFLIGDRALQHPELVARIKAEGHEVANHYFMNGPTLAHSDSRFLKNLAKTEEAIGPLENPKLFRAPGGIALPRQIKLARSQGYTSVLGCAYPHDPIHPPVWYIRWLVEKNLRPGTIVILHDGIPDASRAMEALPHILATGHKRGLRFISIGGLLKLKE